MDRKHSSRWWPSWARTNRDSGEAELPGERAGMDTEILGHHLEGQALAVPARRLYDRPIGHLPDHASPGDVPTIEVGDHRGAVDLEHPGKLVDGGTGDVPRHELIDVGLGQPALHRV